MAAAAGLSAMTEFSSRVERVSISGIREVFEAAGEDAINLGLGQPDFPAPPHARRAAVEAIEAGETDGYTSNKGTAGLREAIAAKHDRDNEFSVDPANVIATAGGSEALHIALEAHVDGAGHRPAGDRTQSDNAGQEVVYPDPGFVSYEALTHLAGGEPEPVALREDLTMDPAAVEDAITDDTAAFVVNSPANPTGAVQSEADMREFARIADEHDVLCISDEVYEPFVFDGRHHSPADFTDWENVVVVNAASKHYSMTGWRLGWVAGSHERIERMLRVHQYVQACASAPAQYAAEAALTGPQDHVEEMREAFEERREVLLDGLQGADLEVPRPQGAFYAMPRVPEGWADEVIDRGVVVVPGEAFGANGAGHARISYAVSVETLKEALEVIREATAAVR
jgi:aspartate aminotransferase